MLALLHTILIAVLATKVFSLVKFYPPKADKHHEKGIYLVEFQIGHVNSKESIIRHLESKSYDRRHVIFRTSIETDLFHGHSFFLEKEHEENHIASIPGVIKVYRVTTIPRPYIVHVDALTMNPLSAVTATKADDIHLLTGVADARSKLGLKGKGIKIAVIDGGVYYPHPALGGCFGPGCRISFGYDLVGDNYPNKSPQPDADPLDNCDSFSHGTHIMGIIMGNATGLNDGGLDFTGVAPEATMGMYRAFGCSGGAGGDIILSAIYLAAQEDAHIINLSIGDILTYPDNLIAVAASRVSAAGHIVIFAAGNDGPQGLFSTSGFADGSSVFAIASFDNVYDAVPALINVNGVQFPLSFSVNNAQFSNPDSFNTIVVNNLNAFPLVTNDACKVSTITQATAVGQTLLIYFNGGCSTATSCTNAYIKGYTKCLMYSNNDMPISIYGSNKIPSASTSKNGANQIISIINSGVTLNVIIQKYLGLYQLPTSGTVSYFSSSGLDYELNIKPEFGAIGGKVLSTISPFAQTTQKLTSLYGIYSGTPMAVPYASGCIALLLQAYGGGKSLNFTQIKTLIQNTAQPANIYNSPMVDSVANQGAGLINIYQAIVSKVIVNPSSLALNDTQFTKQTYALKITNNDDTTPMVFHLSSFGAALVTPLATGDDAIQSKLTTSYTSNYASVIFKTSNNNNEVATTVHSVNSNNNNNHNNQGTNIVNSVTIQARSTMSIFVEFQPPSATAFSSLFPIYSGYIAITSNSSGSDRVVKVPYAGMMGNFYDFPIWSRQSISYSNSFLVGATTGVIDVTSNLPLAANSLISSNIGMKVLPIFLTGCRYYKTEVISAAVEINNSSNYINYGYVSSIGTNRPRDTYLFSGQSMSRPNLYTWNGYVCLLSDCSSGLKKLSPGYYRIKFSGLRHFASVYSDVEADYDVVISSAFALDTTAMPSVVPTNLPISVMPIIVPTVSPSVYSPTVSPVPPVSQPTINPSSNPTLMPTNLLLNEPIFQPSISPTLTPILVPSFLPTTALPSLLPTTNPIITPTIPIITPNNIPTSIPINQPTPIVSYLLIKQQFMNFSCSAAKSLIGEAVIVQTINDATKCSSNSIVVTSVVCPLSSSSSSSVVSGNTRLTDTRRVRSSSTSYNIPSQQLQSKWSFDFMQSTPLDFNYKILLNASQNASHIISLLSNSLTSGAFNLNLKRYAELLHNEFDFTNIVSVRIITVSVVSVPVNDPPPPIKGSSQTSATNASSLNIALVISVTISIAVILSLLLVYICCRYGDRQITPHNSNIEMLPTTAAAGAGTGDRNKECPELAYIKIDDVYSKGILGKQDDEYIERDSQINIYTDHTSFGVSSDEASASVWWGDEACTH